MFLRCRQFQRMASIELAGKSSELSADGKEGKATESNQIKATDGKQCNFIFLKSLKKGSGKFAASVYFSLIGFF